VDPEHRLAVGGGGGSGQRPKKKIATSTIFVANISARVTQHKISLGMLFSRCEFRTTTSICIVS
jgi:hypothetical protein